MEDEEHEVYGGRIPDESNMDADVDMASRTDKDAVKLQELDEMKKRLQVMEEAAAATLREMQAKVVKEMGGVPGCPDTGKGAELSENIGVGNIVLEVPDCLIIFEDTV